MKPKPSHNHEITCALIGQVSSAVPKGQSELSVTTIITRQMWRAFQTEIGGNPDSEPTEWLGIQGTSRVYGSKTIVVGGEGMRSVSFPSELEDFFFHE